TQIKLEEQLKIWTLPNPAKDFIQFSIEVKEKISGKFFIMNTLGQEVASLSEGSLEVGNHSFKLKTNHLPNGTFHYVFVTAGGRLSGTFLLQR
ncbi:MAG: hypothetical protein SFU99_08820, partial [Saprospiraceae bacterium]|nr:hypothetical protein [Saprospiraceae bacterium]